MSSEAYYPQRSYRIAGGGTAWTMASACFSTSVIFRSPSRRLGSLVVCLELLDTIRLAYVSSSVSLLKYIFVIIMLFVLTFWWSILLIRYYVLHVCCFSCSRRLGRARVGAEDDRAWTYASGGRGRQGIAYQSTRPTRQHLLTRNSSLRHVDSQF